MTDEYHERITKNRQARHNYYVREEYEAGIVLVGSEVKSLRDHRVALKDAYGTFIDDELYLVNAHIDRYPHATHENHEPERPRKLLMHRRQIERVRAKIEQEGYTLIPLEMYFKGSRIKVKLGLCEGKKHHDKRQDIKKKEHEREIEREQAKRQKGEYSYDDY